MGFIGQDPVARPHLASRDEAGRAVGAAHEGGGQ